MMFKKGDRVLCVDSANTEHLVKGQWYIVTDTLNKHFITVDGIPFTWNCDRFMIKDLALGL